MIRGNAHATVHLRTINQFLKLVYLHVNNSQYILFTYVCMKDVICKIMEEQDLLYVCCIKLTVERKKSIALTMALKTELYPTLSLHQPILRKQTDAFFRLPRFQEHTSCGI